MDKLVTQFDLKQMEETTREDTRFKVFSGYASVFDVEDHYGDVVQKGAFARTIEHHSRSGKRFPILWQHNHNEPLGVSLDEREDAHGLFVKGELNMDVSRAREAASLMEQGATRGLSIGYDVVSEAWEEGRRLLREVRLWEYSPVTFGANPEALILGVKGVIPADIADVAVGVAWDAAGARSRVSSWAGEADVNCPIAAFQKAFLYCGTPGSEDVNDYYLQIADVVDGKLKVVPGAVFAASAIVYGARPGIELSEKARRALKQQLDKLHAQIGIVPPWSERTNIKSTLALLGGIIVPYELKGGEITDGLSDNVADLLGLVRTSKADPPSAHSDDDGPTSDATPHDEDVSSLEESINILREAIIGGVK